MSVGYFIGLGDKTECGGVVLEGDYGISWDGVIHALEGHKVSCGKDKKTYEILGGVSSFTTDGRRVAGTLDSFSGCPCRAQLLPSVLTASYHGEPSTAVQAARTFRQAPRSDSTDSVGTSTNADTYDEQFSLVDHQGRPHCTLEYLLLQGDQRLASGTLDEQGCSSSQCSSTPSRLNFATHLPSPVLE